MVEETKSPKQTDDSTEIIGPSVVELDGDELFVGGLVRRKKRPDEADSKSGTALGRSSDSRDVEDE